MREMLLQHERRCVQEEECPFPCPRQGILSATRLAAATDGRRTQQRRKHCFDRRPASLLHKHPCARHSECLVPRNPCLVPGRWCRGFDRRARVVGWPCRLRGPTSSHRPPQPRCAGHRWHRQQLVAHATLGTTIADLAREAPTAEQALSSQPGSAISEDYICRKDPDVGVVRGKEAVLARYIRAKCGAP